MFSDRQIEEIIELLSNLNSNTKVYLGCDSKVVIRDEKQIAKFATVCIIHKNGSNGCKVFAHHSEAPNYDARQSRPKMRMMNEVMRVCELYIQLIPYIDQFDIEVHLDINTDPKHGSSCAAQEAAGYVLGMTGIRPKLKPHSWAASMGADKMIKGNRDVYEVAA